MYISRERERKNLKMAWKLSPHVIQVFSAAHKGIPLVVQAFQVLDLLAKCSGALNLQQICAKGMARGKA